MATSISLPRVQSANPFLNALRVLPGITLLAAIGYAAKILERWLNTHTKAHHLTFPRGYRKSAE